jgi:hypothetical protein
MKRSLLTAVLSGILLCSNSVIAQELTISGFAEGAFGGRISDNSYLEDRNYTLNETRLQLQLAHSAGSADFYGSVDFIADNVIDDLTRSSIREAYTQFSIGSSVDAKIGRQILTWGTGDLLFINDVFPKDFVSFFTGREDQYLKHPSDAVKFGFFLPEVSIDLIVTSKFQADLLPDGRRLSYFDPLSGERTGLNTNASIRAPESKFGNSEIAARMYKYLGSFQVAGYWYRGFFNVPSGIDINQGSLYYPDLSTYGASIRGPFWSGIVSAEYGYYDSREDRSGSNPFIPNSQHKFLLGIERQVWTDFTLGIQYYGEIYDDYSTYMNNLPPGSIVFDKIRHLLTARLTQLVFYQNITLSLFGFYSPSDEDWHVRPNTSLKYSDQISLTAGANFFGGTKNHTLFGQFEDNNNIYARVRYYF